ncbi:MAG: hypothetical protein P8Y13_02605 [Deinococcales bacterium]
MDAEGRREHTACPQCGSRDTITYDYVEGFSELECQACGYRSDAEELSALQRYSGDLLESPGAEEELPPVPMTPIEA